MKESDLCSHEHYFNNSENKAWKKIQACTIFEYTIYTSFVGLITFHFTHLFTEAQSVLILAPNRDNDNY